MPATLDLNPPATTTGRDPASWAERVASWLVSLGVLAIPVVCAPDLADRFRVVKESFTRAEALIGVFLILVAVTFSEVKTLREKLPERVVLSIALAGAAWAAVITLLSTHRMLSTDSLVTVLTSIALFLVICYVAPRVRLAVLDLLVPAVLTNTAVAVLQNYSLFNPFKVSASVEQHLRATGLIGNPNIVGAYLALAGVILTAAALHIAGLRRWWYGLGALCAVCGTLDSRSEAAVIAFTAGLGLLVLGRSMKGAIALLIVTGALFGVATQLRLPVMDEILALPQRIRSAGLEHTLSGRVAPAVVALQMVADRPLTGFGPGTYGYHFMPRRTALAEAPGGAYGRGLGVNFAEVHNDHLQILAEGGIPAYLLFLASVIAIVVAGLRAGNTDPRSGFVRSLAVPLAVAFLLLCMVQFPLQVAITRHLVVTMAALIVGWSRV